MTRPTTFPSIRQLGVVLGQLRALDLEHAQRAVHASAVVLARDRLLARIAPLLEVDRTRVEAGLGRKDAIVDLAAEARRPGADAQELELVVVDRRLECARRAPRPQECRSPRSGSLRASPRTTTDECSSSSISHFAANRERSERRANALAEARPRSGGGSRRRHAGGPTSGAITRAFGVRRSASHASPIPSASTSFETIAWRYDAASGPRTPTKSRGRRATRNAVTAIAD